MLCSYLWQCFTALESLPGPCLQFEFDLIKVAASRQWRKLSAKRTEPKLRSLPPRLSVVPRGSVPRPPARVVGNGSLCPVEDTKPSSVSGRALKHEQTTSPYLMQMLFGTKGYAVSQGCDYEAEETHLRCQLINVRLVRQLKSRLYMLSFGSAGHAGLPASPCSVHSAPWLHGK